MNQRAATAGAVRTADKPRDGSRDPWSVAAVVSFWAYAVLLTVATHVPDVNPAYLAPLGKVSLLQPDKTLHLVAYGVLGALAGLAFARGRPVAVFIRLVLVLACWAVIDELTQPFFRRTADVWDWGHDVAGLVIGLSCVALLCRRRGAAGGDAVNGLEDVRPS